MTLFLSIYYGVAPYSTFPNPIYNYHHAKVSDTSIIMNFLSSAKKSAVQAYRTDPNLNRVKGWVAPVCQRLPSATIEYITEKLPVAHWLPHYQYKWLLQDVIAGITIGVMLIPQGLAYAKIATIPVEHGLYSSWVPSALYFFLGTSKGEFLVLFFVFTQR